MVAAASGCGGQSDPVSQVSQAVHVAVGSRGGDFWTYGTALQEVVNDRRAEFRVVVDTAVGIRTLQALNDGGSDCGFAYANLAYESFSGTLVDPAGPLDRLRGVASIEVTPLNLIVPEASTIHNVRDLSGRRIIIGTHNSGSFRAAQLVLEAHGLLGQDGGVEVLATPFGTQAFREGRADAILQLRGRPPGTTESRLRLVPIDGPQVTALRQQYPFFRAALIPMGSFGGQVAPVKTVGIDSVLLCREGISPALVRQLTADWFEAVDRLSSEGRVSHPFSRKAASAAPIPLHQGARDFYRARQVLLRD